MILPQELPKQRTRALFLGPAFVALLLLVMGMLSSFTTSTVMIAKSELLESSTTRLTSVKDTMSYSDGPIKSFAAPVKLPMPEEMFEQWKTRHSIEALQEEVRMYGKIDSNRRFVLAELSCPDRAGNFLNYFTFHLLMAILLDRTLVWTYVEPANVNVYDAVPASNTQANCEKVLRVKSWLPKHSEWTSQLGLRDINVPFTPFLDKGYVQRTKNLDAAELIRFGFIYRTTRTGEMWFHDLLLAEPETFTFWSKFLRQQDNKHFHATIPKLYERGHAYLRGMLFDSVFDFHPSLLQSVEGYLAPPPSVDRVTIGIHARNKNVESDGSDISGFVSCLDQMLRFLDDKPCTVYISSDRPISVLGLTQMAHDRNCSAIAINHEKEDIVQNYTEKENILAEHGPFAGSPFFKDMLLLTKQVRSGFIHSAGFSFGSSASALIWQQIVYNGIQDGSFSHPPLDCSGFQAHVGKKRPVVRIHQT